MNPSVHARSRVERAAGAPQVLIVDDDRDMRGYIRRCLAPLGDRIGPVHEAADGLEALGVAAREGIGLVISDVVMPRLDGLALAGRLKSEREANAKGPVVLLVSGQINADEARTRGAAGLLRKPFDGRTLRSRVTDILERTAS